MKQFFNKLLFRVRKFLATNTFELARNLNEPIFKKEIEENPPILSMAPKVLLEEKELKLINPYLSHLKKAMLDKDILNIAITGNYGSGKSTVIKTFQHLNPQFKYLNISLASFSSSSTDEELEKKLEISILQQIFYHVNPTKIPDSKFKRIKTYRWGQLGTIAMLSILWFYSAFAIIAFDNLKWLNPITWDSQKELELTTILFYFIFILGIILAIKDIIRIVTNSKINKINIKGELEIGEKTKKSVFNEHLEEILYFFEKTTYDTIIIEDLDRFKGTHIFTKLREINTLLNNFESIKNKRKIKFIYAVKDEILKDKTLRVKFFDIIIPIIPFINQSNASEQLTTLIEKNNLKNILSAEFTDDVVSFINDIDMRLLINIFLEYMVFKESLRPELNQDSLFSIVTYKNLFPKDFAKLYKNEGNLFELLNNKQKYIDELKEDTERQANEILKQIDTHNKEFLVNLDTIRRIYLLKIIEKLPRIQSIEVKKELSIFEYLKEENFELLEKNEKIKCYVIDDSSGYLRRNVQVLKFSEIEKEVNPETTFGNRVEIIKSKEKQNRTLLTNRLEELSKKLMEFESFDLSEIFKRLPISNYTKGSTQSPLVKSLIINGYIHEHYRNYISLFHEVSISQSDFNFLNSVLTGGILPFDFKLEKTSNLIKKINEKYFKRFSILNFQILDELILNKEFEDQKIGLFTFLSKENKDTTKFIYSYISRGKFLEVFFNNICRHWEGFWDNIISMKFSDEETDLLLIKIVQFADLDDIPKFNLGYESISHYIEFTPELLSLFQNVDKKRIISIFKKLNIQIEELQSRSELINDLFEYVLANNHYKLNLYNILSILELKDRGKSLYTSINNSKIPEFIQYVESNISFFVDKILLREIGSIKESQEDFLKLLNHPEISIELKDQLISKQEEKIADLKSVNDIEVQKLLLNQVKISSTWNNIDTYFSNSDEEMFDDTLVDFLNQKEVYNDLTSQEIDIWLDESDAQKEKISNMIIYSNKLSLDSFKSVLPTIPFHYDVLDYSKLSEEKASIMIKSNFIFFSVEGFRILSENYPNERISLVELYPEQFLINIEELEIDDELIIHILESKEIKLENKFQFLSKIDGQKMIENYKIASLASNILAISPFMSLTYQQLDKMFRFNFNWEKKITLLLKHFDFLKHEEVIALAEKLTSNKYYANLFQTRKRPTFEKNDLNRDLFVKLEKKGYIKSFDTNPKNENEFRVIANY